MLDTRKPGGDNPQSMNDDDNSARRLTGALKAGARSGLKTTWFLLRIMVPVSLAVAVLAWSGALGWLAEVLRPAMGLLGLPGEAALVFASGVLLSNYSAIAVIGTLNLGMREITILAVMCLLAHNMIVETAVMKKTGSSATRMVLLRLGAALFAAWALNLILPPGAQPAALAEAASSSREPFLAMLGSWGLDTLLLLIKVAVLVFLIMIAQRLMEEYRVTDGLSRVFAPLMRVFGLPSDASILWIVINVVGYAYGAGIVVERVKGGKMKSQSADLFNHHAAISHSLFEDTALYLAIGVPLFWLVFPRLLLALAVVWLEKIRRHWFRRSFKVGTV